MFHTLQQESRLQASNEKETVRRTRDM